ncbi:MAG: HAD hydrolase-like protein [bacterium]|nr:HAD hydrolase-like protein [bacterium]
MTSDLLRSRVPPDLVVFDVDGTLHDTFQWWAPVIRAGLQRFAAAEGMAVTMPTDTEAEAVVGMRDAGVWAPFLPEEHKHRWHDLRAVVLPMEVDEISSGKDYLFPGVRQLLPHLRAIGVGTALASNCRSQYMNGMMQGQGLAAISDHQFCLDSENVDSKTDMLREAQRVTGAERPVMVGDREPDHEAAVALGWPFIWRENTRCRIDDADLIWRGDPSELLMALALRPF